MNARIVLFAFIVAKDAWTYVIDYLLMRHLRKPLPKEVACIHDAKSWADFLELSMKEERLCLVNDICARAIDFALIFSPFFAWVDSVCGQDILPAFIATTALVSLAHTPTSYATALITEFKVRKRYGQSNISFAEFNKDFLIDKVSTLVASTLSLCLIVALCSDSANRLTSAEIQPRAIVNEILRILPAFLAIAIFLALVGLAAMLASHKFSSLPEGDLRTEIERMLGSCRKRVRWLTIYNESAKSNEENAFVLRIPGFRMISIADNVLDDGDKNKALATVAHEIGHLKHRFRPYDLLGYIPLVVILLVLGLCLMNVNNLLSVDAWVRKSFRLSNFSAYLGLQFMNIAMAPINYLVEIPDNYVSRKHEYEADRNAVAEGYGQELIEFLSSSSKKELGNVNTHPLVEFLELSHPALPNRLRAITEAMETVPEPNTQGYNCKNSN